MIESNNLSDHGDKQKRTDKTASPLMPYCTIDFRKRLFATLLQFDIIALLRRRIRSVPLKKLP